MANQTNPGPMAYILRAEMALMEGNLRLARGELSKAKEELTFYGDQASDSREVRLRIALLENKINIGNAKRLWDRWLGSMNQGVNAVLGR